MDSWLTLRVAATKANPPPGLPDGPVDVDTGRKRYVNGTLLTTPELLADAIAAKRAADRRDRAAVDRATTLAQTVADALGIDTPPRATATRDGNVRLELTTAQIDAILGEG